MIIFLIAQATLVGKGAVTILNFSLNIFMLPITVIAMSYAIASFPEFSKLFAEKNKEDFKKRTNETLSIVFFFAAPISLFIIFYAKDIVGLLLGSEKFGLEEIKITAFLISTMTAITMFFIFNSTLSRILLATSKTKIIFFINLIIVLLIFFFVNILKKVSWSDWKVFVDFLNFSDILNEKNIQLFVLVFAYSLSFTMGAFIWNYFFKKILKDFISRSLIKKSGVFKKISAAFISVFVSKIFLNFLNISEENSFWIFFLNIAIGGMVFLFLWVFVSEFLKDREYLEFRKKVIKFIKINYENKR